MVRIISDAPTKVALIEITFQNSYQSGGVLPGGVKYFSYTSFVATDSDSPLSMVSFDGSGSPAYVYLIASRQSFSAAQAKGVMIEVYRFAALEESDAVALTLAQVGATTYSPPTNQADVEYHLR